MICDVGVRVSAQCARHPSHDPRQGCGMQPTARHREAEARFRGLLADAGLAPPDAVEIRSEELVFYWSGPKVAVVVELDGAGVPAPEGSRADGSGWRADGSGWRADASAPRGLV